MRSNKEILSTVFEASCTQIGRNTSHTYALVTLNNIIKKLVLQFPFLLKVNLGASSTGSDIYIVIDDSINETSRHDIGRFLTELINILFVSDEVRGAIMNGFSSEFVQELQSMGVIL